MLLKTEGVQLSFSDDALRAIAEVAEQANQQMENIGARRLYTILELVGAINQQVACQHRRHMCQESHHCWHASQRVP